MRGVTGLKDWDELPGTKVFEYLEAYARKFRLLERCRLSTHVRSVRRDEDGRQWVVETQFRGDGKGNQNNESELLRCDKLVLAGGMCSKPHLPNVPARDFAGPIMHTKDIGVRYSALMSPSVQRVAVYGGGKSAVDAVNLCIEVGKHVDWIIRTEGGGPGLMAEIRLKYGLHVGQFVGRWKDIFSPSIFSVGTFWNRFFYSGKNRWGTWLIRKFWNKASQKQLTLGPYKLMTEDNRRKLLPNGSSALFSMASGSALHSCPSFIPELGKADGLIKVHRASITILQEKELSLSNGVVLPCDAVVYATGWSFADDLFPPDLGMSLGLPESSEYQDEATKAYWADLHSRADEEVVRLLPILKEAPPPNRDLRTHTAFRLYRYMVPPALAARGDRSLAFIGYLSSIQTCIFNEVAALWAVAWLEDLVDLGVPADRAQLDYEVARVNAWSERRYLGRGHGRPVAGGEIQLVVDLLMMDLGLRVKRKGGLGIMDTFVPYRSQDYLGIVDEVLERSRREKTRRRDKRGCT